MCRVCECLMDNEVPKQLNLSSNGITNESGTGEQYLLFGFSCSLVSRRTPSTWFLFLEYSRYPHPGGLWTPLSQSLIHSYFLGPQLVWGFITILYLCHALLLYLRLCEEHLYCFGCGVFSRYRQAQSHFRVPSRLQPLSQTLGPFWSRPTSLRVA